MSGFEIVSGVVAPKNTDVVVEYLQYDVPAREELDYKELCKGCKFLQDDGSCVHINKAHDPDDIGVVSPHRLLLPLTNRQITRSVKKARKIIRKNRLLRRDAEGILQPVNTVLKLSKLITNDTCDAYGVYDVYYEIEGNPIGKAVLKQVLRKDCASINSNKNAQTEMAKKITNGEIDLSKLIDTDDLR